MPSDSGGSADTVLGVRIWREDESTRTAEPTTAAMDLGPLSTPDLPVEDDSGGTLSFRSLPSIGELRRLLRTEFTGYGTRAVGIGVLGGLAALIELVIVLAIANLGSALLSDSGDAPIDLALGIQLSRTQLAGLTVVAVVVRGLVEVGYIALQTRALTSYEVSARSTILDAYIDAEWREQSAEQPAQFVNATYAFLGTSRNTYRRTMDVITALISFLLMIAGSFVIGGIWAFGIIGGAAVISLALRPVARRSHRAGSAARDAAHRFGDAMWETVLLARETRVLGIADIVNRRNRLAAADVAHANRSRDLLSGLSASAYSSALYGIVTLGLLLVSVVNVADPARIVAILLLLYRGLGYGRTFQSMYQEVVNSEPSIHSLRETRERLDRAQMPHGGLRLEGELREVNFQDVGFAYEDGRSALSGVNVRITEGDTLGVVGPSGAGKSTFVHLMLRLLLPTHGQVLVNGLDLASLEPDSWFGRAVLVPQDARAYDGTVLENVTCHRPDVTERDARDALRAAHLLNEMEALPDGLHTVVTGNRLSGGQRQRLAIARALAGRPDILVLDEPTSALDLLSEEAIRRTLEALRGRVTLVIVAHRLSTLRICDRVAVFEDGRIEAIGSREDLEAGSAFYAEALRLARLV